MKVLGAGDNVIDRYCHAGVGYPGGNAVNFSVYAAMLGVNAAYQGIFADDRAAEHLKKVLTARQIDISHCLTVAGESGYASLTINDGERIFLESNAGGVRQSTAMDFMLATRDWLAEFALIHTSAYSYIDHLLPALSTLPGKLSYDFSDDFLPGQALPLCKWLDYAFFSCAGKSLRETQHLLTAAQAQGCPLVVATRGVDGAILFDGVHWHEVKPVAIRPVDTLGAGDGFITAFLLAHLQHKTLSASLDAAAVFASEICALHGAFGEPLAL
ncbi:PfkB family carbohydrate kinase [Pantoea sp. B65]|uniref:PfkB family carbohydrate kinase n=1 Tax=Pantoea sp. B65 TaxID=2813359 RepID=UPI0039B41493